MSRPRTRTVEPAGVLLSDRDRDRAIVTLRDRYADGSLTLDEYSRRVDEVLAGHTRVDVDRALEGLRRRRGPQRSAPTTRARRRVAVRGGIAVTTAVAILVVGLAISRQGDQPRFDRNGVVVGTLDPLASVPAADVYIVPLDRSAWNEGGAFSLLRLRSELTKRGLKTVLAPPLAINGGMYDSNRNQLNGDALSAALDSAYWRHPSAWPATVVGVTSLDMYSPTFSGDRFVFMSSHGRGAAGFAAISTARMHHGFFGGGSAADLEKMAARAVGLYFYRLPRSAAWSLMHDPIRSQSDLEKMSDGYGVSRALLERRKRETRHLRA